MYSYELSKKQSKVMLYANHTGDQLDSLPRF